MLYIDITNIFDGPKDNFYLIEINTDIQIFTLNISLLYVVFSLTKFSGY